MAKTSHNIREWSQLGFQDFISKTLIDAPFTQITNRAKIKTGLTANMGVSRIHTTSLNLLANEFGPNGEPVYEADSKDQRVRFVGHSWEKLSDNNGTRPQLRTNAVDFVEITFYGTGLNVLTIAGSGVTDTRATIDGGAEGSNIMTATNSTILNTRNTRVHNIVQVTSGLSLGWHTVKLRRNTGDFAVYGFEILSQTTQVAIESGSGFSGVSKETLAALSYSDYDAGVVGAKGARVVKYLKDGVYSQAVQETDASALYLSSTNHTNEELVRRINFREFGANRGDDFSTLAGVQSGRAFTLDDGTTTLVASSVVVQNDAVLLNINGSFATLTFVGTGLDVVWGIATGGGTNANANAHEVFVDGVSQGNWETVGAVTPTHKKICSGLPYGTHTVKFLRNAPNVWGLSIHDFLIYQPKTPSIPAGAVEIARYNVLADFVPKLTSGIEPSQGVIGKSALREMRYIGTWVLGTLDPLFRNGFNVSTLVNTSYVEYHFYGTGIEHNFYSSNGSGTIFDYTIDGASNLSGYTTNFVHAAPGPVTWNPAIGRISGGAVTTSQYGARLSISGLPLGRHTLRIVETGGQLWTDALDIITPIYEPIKNVGSNALVANTNTKPIAVEDTKMDLGKAKVLLRYDPVNNIVINSYNVSAILVTGDGLKVFFEKNFKNTLYYVALSVNESTPTGSWVIQTRGEIKQNSITVVVHNNNGGAGANIPFSLIIFGELENEGEE